MRENNQKKGRKKKTYVDFDLILGTLDDAALDTGQHLDLANNLLAQEVANLDVDVAVDIDVDGEMRVHGLQLVLVALFADKEKTKIRTKRGMRNMTKNDRGKKISPRKCGFRRRRVP